MNIRLIMAEREIEYLVKECKKKSDCNGCRVSKKCSKYKGMAYKFDKSIKDLFPEQWEQSILDRLALIESGEIF